MQLRAARHGRSAEAEHRAILEAELRREARGSSFEDVLCAMPDVGEDADFARIEGGFRASDP